MFFDKKYSQYILLLTIGIGLAIVAIAVPGTCDSGDSITHYLFARYAYAHPENFLDHWAKPVFTFLAAPFAQLGFTGIKIFNVLVSIGTLFLVLRIAQQLQMKRAILAPLFLLAFPMYTITIFSGLTEPLFALVLSLGIFLLLRQRHTASALVFSFLPFCRSEGLIVLGLVGIYFLFHRRYVNVLWLLAGHLVMAVAGAFYYTDLLWVFKEIPYVGVDSYGRGGWRHFFEGAPMIFGIPLLSLLVVGLFADVSKMFRPGAGTIAYLKMESTLISGIFISIFAAHVIFWKFGLFHSFGLLRVIVAVLPMAALVALFGFNQIVQWIEKKNGLAAKATGGLLLLYVFIFPFTPNPAAFNFRKDFGKKSDQLAIDRAVERVKRDHPGAKIYSSHYYMAMAMDIDPFDSSQYEGLWFFKRGEDVPPGSVIIWDSWFALNENGVSETDLVNDARFVKRAEFEEDGSKVSVFLRKSP